MSFTGNLIKIIKKFDRHEEHYALFTEIIGKLQPIAFLISVSLVLAVFFDKNSISRTYALFASLLFFLAYLGFAFYKITKYKLSFYWGLFLTLISVTLIYYAFGDVFTIIFNGENKRIMALGVYIVYSMLILITKFILDLTNKNNCLYKICNPALYIIGLFVLIYVPIGIYLNLTFIPMFFVMMLLILIFFISLFNLDKHNYNSP